LARDRKSVKEIIAGFTSGSIDVVLQKAGENRQVLSGIRDVAWRTRDKTAIRRYLQNWIH
jgi:hypothetical protein